MTSSKLVLPLYRDEAIRDLHARPQNAHPGLWYEKFCNRWIKKENKWELNKQEWISTVTGMVGDREQIQEMVERIQQLVEARNGNALYMKTAGRFVTGLGRSHPVENGFAWHPILGTAYLPGSSIKGVVRAWVTQWKGTNPDIVNRIFGTEGEGSHRVGSVIFFDAIPIGPLRLEMEIMTPHYAPYYKNPKSPPYDWYAPNPIPFLTVASDQTFMFTFAPRRNEQEKDMQMVEEWLTEALDWMGAGAKTAVGYGRFVKDEIKQQAWMEWREKRRKEKEEELAFRQMSPIEREMKDDGYEQFPERFMEALTNKWLPRLKEIIAAQPERYEIAERLAEWYQVHRPDSWKKPNKKNKAKVELIKQILSER